MKKILILFILIISCKSKSNFSYKNNTRNKTVATRTASSSNSKGSYTAEKILKTAKSYQGTKYKYGGTSKAGMDCSGLIYTSYKTHKIILPRRSVDMSKKGKSIPLSKTIKGDLLFFVTGKSGNISHVGMVVSNYKGVVKFIHASTSKGVVVSSMTESYWKKTYKLAKRVI